MKIIINIFCPVPRFLDTNLATINNIFEQYKPMYYDKYDIILIGCCYKPNLIKDILKTKYPHHFNVINFNVINFDERYTVIGKCDLINKSIINQFIDLVFYCEYDMLVCNLFDKLEQSHKLFDLNKDIGILSFNYNCHQLTIYEQIIPQFESVTLLKPYVDNGHIIATACFIIKLTKPLSNIIFDNYGYGQDDYHINSWLKSINLNMAVVMEWNADHNYVQIPEYIKWKQDIIKNNVKLSKADNLDFWKQML